jgi:MFS family permease
MARLILLGIVYVSFISLGLPDGVLGVAWPAIRADMDQPLAAVGIITIAMTVSAAASSFFAGSIVKRVGTGLVVAASCLMTALALLNSSFVCVVGNSGYSARGGCGRCGCQPEPLCGRALFIAPHELAAWFLGHRCYQRPFDHGLGSGQPHRVDLGRTQH